jgi:hypothetical protein
MVTFIFCVVLFLFIVVWTGSEEALTIEAWYLVARPAFRGTSAPRLFVGRLALSVVLCQFAGTRVVVIGVVVETCRGQLIA